MSLGCSPRSPHSGTAVFAYEDFGPQVIANPLIGMAWYQWNNHGGSDPKKVDKVQVVVYRGLSIDEVKKKYPVISEQQDFRYLDYKTAWDYLSKNERDPQLRHLSATKNRLAAELGPPTAP